MDYLRGAYNAAATKFDSVTGTDLEKMVKEATSNENWGSSGTTKTDIAKATFEYQGYREVMPIIWKRLQASPDQWRIVFKSLDLLDFLIKNGADRVAQDARDRQLSIRGLQDFQYVDPETGLDRGRGIREVSRAMCELLNDWRTLQSQREEARRTRRKLNQISTSGFGSTEDGAGTGGGGGGNYGGYGGGSNDNYGNNNNNRTYEDPWRDDNRDAQSPQQSDDRDSRKKRKKKKKKKHRHRHSDGSESSEQEPEAVPEPRRSKRSKRRKNRHQDESTETEDDSEGSESDRDRRSRRRNSKKGRSQKGNKTRSNETNSQQPVVALQPPPSDNINNSTQQTGDAWDFGDFKTTDPFADDGFGNFEPATAINNAPQSSAPSRGFDSLGADFGFVAPTTTAANTSGTAATTQSGGFDDFGANWGAPQTQNQPPQPQQPVAIGNGGLLDFQPPPQQQAALPMFDGGDFFGGQQQPGPTTNGNGPSNTNTNNNNTLLMVDPSTNNNNLTNQQPVVTTNNVNPISETKKKDFFSNDVSSLVDLSDLSVNKTQYASFDPNSSKKQAPVRPSPTGILPNLSSYGNNRPALNTFTSPMGVPVQQNQGYQGNNMMGGYGMPMNNNMGMGQMQAPPMGMGMNMMGQPQMGMQPQYGNQMPNQYGGMGMGMGQPNYGGYQNNPNRPF